MTFGALNMIKSVYFDFWMCYFEISNVSQNSAMVSIKFKKKNIFYT